MPSVAKPSDEAGRLAALQSYEVLDTECEAAFDNITSLAARLTGSPIAMVSLIDAERAWFKARHGLDATEMPRQDTFCAHAILNPDQTLVIPDARADPRFADYPMVRKGGMDVRFYAGVALVNPEGAVLGTLCILDRQPRDMTSDQVQILQRLAETVCTTLELRRAMNRVRGLALVDALTGIANRAAMIHAIKQAIIEQEQLGIAFTLFYINLDNFKGVNDERGHAEGDEVLKEVASTLTTISRRDDRVGRLDGDEFVVLLIGDEVETYAAADKVRYTVELRMQTRGWPVTVSVGAISFVEPPGSADEALTMADRLMYAAKAAGKNRVHVQGSKALLTL